VKLCDSVGVIVVFFICFSVIIHVNLVFVVAGGRVGERLVVIIIIFLKRISLQTRLNTGWSEIVRKKLKSRSEIR
jgi:hypothetical protein